MLKAPARGACQLVWLHAMGVPQRGAIDAWGSRHSTSMAVCRFVCTLRAFGDFLLVVFDALALHRPVAENAGFAAWASARR